MILAENTGWAWPFAWLCRGRAKSAPISSSYTPTMSTVAWRISWAMPR